jgi:hypothetical protein
MGWDVCGHQMWLELLFTFTHAGSRSWRSRIWGTYTAERHRVPNSSRDCAFLPSAASFDELAQVSTRNHADRRFATHICGVCRVVCMQDTNHDRSKSEHYGEDCIMLLTDQWASPRW